MPLWQLFVIHQSGQRTQMTLKHDLDDGGPCRRSMEYTNHEKVLSVGILQANKQYKVITHGNPDQNGRRYFEVNVPEDFFPLASDFTGLF